MRPGADRRPAATYTRHGTTCLLAALAVHFILDMPEVDGVKPESMFAVCPTVAFNMFSRCPAMTVPSGFARNGVPTGVQIACSPFDEIGVFAAALSL